VAPRSREPYDLGVIRKLLGLVVLAAVLVSPRTGRADPPADPFFGRDKALHFGFSAALAAGGYGLSALVVDGKADRIAIGATFALGAGYSKEVVDALGFGTPSWKDLAWDVIGTAVGLGISVAVDAAFTPVMARAR
jgi:putative lipoprotein